MVSWVALLGAEGASAGLPRAVDGVPNFQFKNGRDGRFDFLVR